MNRIERLAGFTSTPLLVTNLVNVYYLTGMESSCAALLVDPAGSAILFTDYRYLEAAQDIAGVEAEVVRGSVMGTLPEFLSGKRVAVEATSLSLAAAESLKADGVDLVPTAGLVERLRVVKDRAELELLRRAAEASDRVYDALSHERFVGRYETDLAWWIGQAWRDLGADGSAFDPIVAHGSNTARPHAKPRDDRISEGELVLVDAGCTIQGYRSDCTRMFFTGEPEQRLRELHDICLQSRADALGSIEPGTTGGDLDARSRVCIDAAGLGDDFSHGLGHGIGLELHEAPRIHPESRAPLRSGTVVTVEPGIYLSGDLGVRVEDMISITEEGYEMLTKTSRELIQVD